MAIRWKKDFKASRDTARRLNVKTNRCWPNALEIAVDEGDPARYVEGYAVAKDNLIPFEHGWVQRGDEIIDPTFPDSDLLYFPGPQFTPADAIAERDRETPTMKKGELPIVWRWGGGGQGHPEFARAWAEASAFRNPPPAPPIPTELLPSWLSWSVGGLIAFVLGILLFRTLLAPHPVSEPVGLKQVNPPQGQVGIVELQQVIDFANADQPVPLYADPERRGVAAWVKPGEAVTVLACCVTDAEAKDRLARVRLWWPHYTVGYLEHERIVLK